jgi:hypothetical protein
MIDIFIPVTEGNLDKLPGTICSALTQSYRDIRLVIWLDKNETVENILNEWFYIPEDTPWSDYLHPNPITLEHATRGVIVRNSQSESIESAQRWMLEWPEKSEYVKFLGQNDILTPECLEIMMRYMTAECHGVLCPIARVFSSMYKDIILERGFNALLLKKSTMEQIAAGGSLEQYNFVDTLPKNYLYIQQK